MYILYEDISLYKTFWKFISIVTRHDCHDYIGQIWNQFENVYIRFFQKSLWYFYYEFLSNNVMFKEVSFISWMIVE